MTTVKPPPPWMVRLNVAMLRRGLSIGSQHLLTVRGRKSGQLRGTPVSIATVEGNRYIVAAFTDAAWVWNVRAAESATLSRGRSIEAVRLIELPVDERGPVLRAFLQQVRGGARVAVGGCHDGIGVGRPKEASGSTRTAGLSPASRAASTSIDSGEPICQRLPSSGIAFDQPSLPGRSHPLYTAM
jgi:deazaflavin-dependent oxidoreductase (nitroreductase family)